MEFTAFEYAAKPMSLYAGLLAIISLASLGYYILRRERLPDVEFLRIVDKPGKGGDAEDIEAFMKDSLSAIMKGYNQVCPASSLETELGSR